MFSSAIRTVIIYLVVIFAMRLMGKRQLGELQPSELVTTFLISNVASICIDEPDLPLLSSLVPILLLASLEILNSTAAWYFPGYASLLFGRSMTVIFRGSIDQQALKHLRITTGDLMEALRGQEVFDPRQVWWGVVEPNGRISIAKRSEESQDLPMLPLIVDGRIFSENLALLGRSSDWLDRELQEKSLRAPDVLVFLDNGREQLWIPKKDRPEGRS